MYSMASFPFMINAVLNVYCLQNTKTSGSKRFGLSRVFQLCFVDSLVGFIKDNALAFLFCKRPSLCLTTLLPKQHSFKILTKQTKFSLRLLLTKSFHINSHNHTEGFIKDGTDVHLSSTG